MTKKISIEELKAENSWGINAIWDHEEDHSFLHFEDEKALSETARSKLGALLKKIDWDLADKGIIVNH